MVCLGSFLSAFVSTSHQIEDSESFVPDLPKLCALRVCHQARMGFISPNPGDILHLLFFLLAAVLKMLCGCCTIRAILRGLECLSQCVELFLVLMRKSKLFMSLAGGAFSCSLQEVRSCKNEALQSGR